MATLLPRRTAGLLASAAISVLLLSACAPETPSGSPGDSPAPSGSASGTPTPNETNGVDASPTPSPSSTTVALPTDCRAILNASVLAQLEEVPLNDPAFGASGAQADGSLICVWGDPGADTTSLVTTIEYVNRGPALDMLNALANDEGFTCFTPDGGTRCEKTWQNETYPVTDGRTLFWRDDVLIDTRYSNLAPSGYTSAIIVSMWG
ncbi:hypothetical protein LG299_13760 [Microbacterium lacus]|uniref:hypothetical protein n=1 Tax=Microbacterium lacus TaxID=415217 RepID=UPI00384B84B5